MPEGVGESQDGRPHARTARLEGDAGDAAFDAPVVGGAGGREDPGGLVWRILGGAADADDVWRAVDLLGLRRTSAFRCIVLLARDARAVRPPHDDLESLPMRTSIRWARRPNFTVGLVEEEAIDVTVIQEALTGSHWTGGISPTITSWASGGQALRFASAAAHGAPTPGVALFERSPLEVMAGAAPDLTARASLETLRPLYCLSLDHRGLLLEAVSFWFEESGSIPATAKRLFVHPNTVRNRLSRFEQAVHRSLKDPADIAAIAMALVGLKASAG